MNYGDDLSEAICIGSPPGGIMTVWSVLQTVLPALIAFVSGLFGAWFGGRQQKQSRRLEFRRQQLEQFYSPLIGMKEHIIHMSRLRLRVSDAADAEWQETAERFKPGYNSENLDSEAKPFDAIIEYENKQLTKDILPLYRDMLKLFKDKYYLMEESTRGFYQPLFDFVELWDRWLCESIPVGVMKRVRHDGSFLDAIGLDVIHHIDAIRKELLMETKAKQRVLLGGHRKK